MNEPLANSKTSSATSNGERRSASVDFCRTERSPRVGVESEGLRAVEAEDSKAPRGEREESSYVIDAGLKMLKVLECLEGRSYEPVGINRVMQRSGFNRDLTRRLLITAKKAGWVKEIISGRERLFFLGPKAENLARGFSATLLSQK